MKLISHILIGCPGSGKSTIAAYFLKNNPNISIISTDKIRQLLFGDENCQGDWQLIEKELLNQIGQAFREDKEIVYDATNYRRPWRMTTLNTFKSYGDRYWLGWYLRTPLEVCLRWNGSRNRQVPPEVIEKIHEYIERFPPLLAEGFAGVHELSFRDGRVTTDEIDIQLRNFSPVTDFKGNRRWHRYSRLQDFDRLLHLIGLLVNYPLAGNYRTVAPEFLKGFLGVEASFETDLAEITALMAKYADPLYADEREIDRDVEWLRTNGILGEYHDRELEPAIVPSNDIIPHPYSDSESFSRLLKTIRSLVHHHRDSRTVTGEYGKILTSFRILPG